MTLVTRMHWDGKHPLLLGDLLLSAETSSENMIDALPTEANTAALKDRLLNRVPTGLSQKLSVLSPNLAVGWSGIHKSVTRDSARDVLNHLKTLCDDEGNCDWRRVSAFITQLRTEDISLTGFVMNNGLLAHFGPSGASFQTEWLGNAAAIGLGAPAATQMLKSFRPPDDVPRNAPWPDCVLHTVLGGLVISGHLLTHECVTKDSIVETFFGGGYELVYYGPNGFTKLDGVTHVVNHLHLTEDDRVGQSCLPVMVTAYKYTDDILTFRSHLLGTRDAGDLVVNGITGDVLPPYLSPSSHKSCPLPDLNNPWQINHFQVGFEHHGIAHWKIVSIPRYVPACSQAPIEFDKDGRIVMTDRTFFEPNVAQMLKRVETDRARLRESDANRRKARVALDDAGPLGTAFGKSSKAKRTAKKRAEDAINAMTRVRQREAERARRKRKKGGK